MMQNAGVLYILTCKCAWRHSGVPFFDNFSTSALQKVARDRQFFTILTWKCASRYSGVQFFNIATSKSGPRMLCFVHFDLQMCFSLQRRAIFQHRNFKKWSAHDSFFSILTSKCASRYSGVQFFMSSLNSHLRTRRFSEVTFRPSRHTKHWKTQHFATSLTFRACWSSFFPHPLIFFLAALLFQLSILSEVRLLNFLWLLYIYIYKYIYIYVLPFLPKSWNGTWVPPILVSTSMIMGERVYPWVILARMMGKQRTIVFFVGIHFEKHNICFEVSCHVQNYTARSNLGIFHQPQTSKYLCLISGGPQTTSIEINLSNMKGDNQTCLDIDIINPYSNTQILWSIVYSCLLKLF